MIIYVFNCLFIDLYNYHTGHNLNYSPLQKILSILLNVNRKKNLVALRISLLGILYNFRFINEKPVEAGVRFHIEERKGYADVVHSLSIDTTDVADSGTVKAKAVNRVGEATTDASLIVDGRLYITIFQYLVQLFFK